MTFISLTCAWVFAQTDPKDGYLNWAGENQSRNIPAGSATDPGSHLTYIIDTGVNARAIAGVADLSTVAAAAKSPLEKGSLLASRLDADGDGRLDPGAMYQNFIAVTNTNHKLAVTVHIRYSNDNCSDLLGFLIVLRCNETLLIDPFDFVIPFTDGANTRSRMIGPSGPLLDPITVEQWGSGRFLITVAACGTTLNADSDPEILFPREFAEFDARCNIRAEGALDGSNTLEQVLSGAVQNMGESAGVNAANLHAFNASQISFNYLIGHLTTAVPKGFIKDAGPLDLYLAYGVHAWARPSVDRSQDLNINPLTGRSDGDGPPVATGTILWGGESGRTSAGDEFPGANHYYLRNDVHGGDISAIQGEHGTGGNSLYGALGTTPFYPIRPDNQVIHLLSVADDYNGSKNDNFEFWPEDHGANLAPAATTYILQIYDNEGDLFTFFHPIEGPLPEPEIPAMHPPKITCICSRLFLHFSTDPKFELSEFAGATSVDALPQGRGANQTGGLELDDLYFVGGAVFQGLADFWGLLEPLPIETGNTFKSEDLSGGWIRFVRDNTLTVGLPGGLPADTATGLGGLTAVGPGTSTFDDARLSDYDALGPSFLTIGLYVVKFEGFGASWYLHAVAADPRISEIGKEADY